LRGEAPACKKAFVCRYHGWTYDLRGRLIHVPHVESFEGRDGSRRSLVDAHVAERHGFVWVGLEPFDLDTHFGALNGDLEALANEDLVLHRRKSRDVEGNWKLVIDAFLD